MKYKISLILMLFNQFFRAGDLASQTYSSEFSLIDILEKRGINEDVDSLINKEFVTLRSKLQTQKSESEIERLLIGKWKPIGSFRANADPAEIFSNERMTFTSEFSFSQIEEGNIKEGRYFVKTGETSNLELVYNDPQLPPFPKETLEGMDEEQIKNAMYNTSLYNIFEINENELLLYVVFPLIDLSNPIQVTHSRLIVERFIKE